MKKLCYNKLRRDVVVLIDLKLSFKCSTKLVGPDALFIVRSGTEDMKFGDGATLEVGDLGSHMMEHHTSLECHTATPICSNMF